MDQQTTVDYEAFDDQFVKNLYTALYRRDNVVHELKRAFGRSMNENVATYLSFLKVVGNDVPKKNEHIYFLVACLFCKLEKPVEDLSNKKSVRFEELLHRIYGQTNSTDRFISSFLEMTYDSAGLFEKQFVRMYNRCIREMQANERLDYRGLLKDLKFWNDETRWTKMRWAQRIVKSYTTKEENKND